MIPRIQPLARRPRVGRERHRILVVLTNEDHGYMEQDGQDHGLVESAGGSGPVAKKRQQDPSVPAHLDPNTCANSHGNAAADYAVSPEIATGHIGDVHRAAASSAIANFFAVELGHHQVQVRALGDTESVSPVMAQDVIVWI